MDSSNTSFSALDSLDTVAFKQGFRGYNIDEVDDFLERLRDESNLLKDQLHQLRQQLRQAGERINQLEGGRPAAPAPARPAPAAPTPPPARPTPVGAEQVTSMIQMAQQFIDQAQAEAEAKARELTVAAQERAREIVAEARSRAEDEVNRLNGLKQRLSEDVEKLSRQLETERTRLASVLAELGRWVESALHVGGASRISAAPAPVATPVATAEEPMPPASPALRPVPPPAPPPAAPVPPTTIGQALRFETESDERR